MRHRHRCCVPATKGTIGILARLLPLLRSAFPRAYFLVRLDGGFATPALFDFLDAEPDVRYVVAMAKNAHAEPALDHARAESTRTGRTGTRLRRNALWTLINIKLPGSSMPRGKRRFPHGAYSGPVDRGASLPGPHRAENEPPPQGDKQLVSTSVLCRRHLERHPACRHQAATRPTPPQLSDDRPECQTRDSVSAG